MLAGMGDSQWHAILWRGTVACFQLMEVCSSLTGGVGNPVPNSVGLPCAAQTLKIVITTWFAAAILEVGCSCDFECLSTCWGSLCGAGAPRRLLQPLMSTSGSLRPSKAMQPSRLCCWFPPPCSLREELPWTSGWGVVMPQIESHCHIYWNIGSGWLLLNAKRKEASAVFSFVPIHLNCHVWQINYFNY